jgi:alkanesulfonate monooxygenase SsuD/methylene tetrahydromethanopterin reductase-like flavin-dependent oxidoreductase (luciferase family)
MPRDTSDVCADVPDLAVHLGGHHRSFGEVLALVERAEALGYRTAYVDGDVTVVPSRGDDPVLDGWTATVALLARTSRIEIGSIRLVHQWNAARLAQAVATAECVAPGRLRFLASIGGQPSDRRFGFALPPASERIAWLDEWLAALRRLWAGERVTVDGRYVTLDDAFVRPLPRGGSMPIEVGGAGARLLEVVARHADRWDLNIPPVARLVRDATSQLASACQAVGRDPTSIGRSMWLFARPGRSPGDASLAVEFRRWHSWFRSLPDADVGEAILTGPTSACRARIAAIRGDLGIDLPVLDLAGLSNREAERALIDLAGA